MGVLAEVGGKLVPANQDKETKRYLVHHGWKLSRFVSAYAVDLPFAVEVVEDGVRCLIPPHRLSDTMKRRASTLTAQIRGFPLSATVAYCDESYRNISVMSCGGIFVDRMRELKLHALGLPKWGEYVIDLAPQRTRINLARTDIMEFALGQTEQLEVWRVSSEQIDAWRKTRFGKVDQANYESETDELWRLIGTLPGAAQSLKREMALEHHHVAMLQCNGREWRAWFGRLGEFGRSGVTKLVLASVGTASGDFASEVIARHLTSGKALAFDCNLSVALATSGISVAREN